MVGTASPNCRCATLASNFPVEKVVAQSAQSSDPKGQRRDTASNSLRAGKSFSSRQAWHMAWSPLLEKGKNHCLGSHIGRSLPTGHTQTRAGTEVGQHGPSPIPLCLFMGVKEGLLHKQVFLISSCV